ncbi:MAG: transglutaminase family protein [candidate division Zixibacteria bacterium]|nr:transglutaminase family protein [candidate division Zixibacteria bacterium]
MNPAAETSELNALIRLLSDDDPAVHVKVDARLISMGEVAAPALWKAFTESIGKERDRIAGILSRVSADAGKELTWQEWRRLNEKNVISDLERGVALIARSHYEQLDWTPYGEQLDRMADELAVRLGGVTDSTGIVQTMTEYLFQEERFHGSAMEDYEPDDGYINRVLDRRRGLPISLSAICLLVGRRLAIPLYGIGLPGHFIMMYRAGDAEILFDPYHSGLTVSREKCEELLIQRQYARTEDFFVPYSNRMILARMLGNLHNFYLKLQDRERLATVTRYFKLVTAEGT